jgi:DNA ligase (NAD+)
MPDISQKINQLRKIINEHNYNYYVLDKPRITDFEFDQLLKELELLEIENPQYFDSNSQPKELAVKSQKNSIPLITAIECTLWIIPIQPKRF